MEGKFTLAELRAFKIKQLRQLAGKHGVDPSLKVEELKYGLRIFASDFDRDDDEDSVESFAENQGGGSELSAADQIKIMEAKAALQERADRSKMEADRFKMEADER